MSNFIHSFYLNGGIAQMFLCEVIRGIGWTLGAVIVIKVLKVKI